MSFDSMPDPVDDPDTGYVDESTLWALPELNFTRVATAIQLVFDRDGDDDSPPDIQFGEDLDGPDGDYPEPDDIYGPSRP